MISLSYRSMLRQYSFKFFGIKHIVDVPEIEFTLPLSCEWDSGDMILKQAEIINLILN